MKTIVGKYNHSLVVDEPYEVIGVVDGTITVKPGALLKLCGVCKGDMILEEGSDVTVQGMIDGDVVNYGGKFRILGVVRGSVKDVLPRLSNW